MSESSFVGTLHYTLSPHISDTPVAVTPAYDDSSVGCGALAGTRPAHILRDMRVSAIRIRKAKVPSFQSFAFPASTTDAQLAVIDAYKGPSERTRVHLAVPARRARRVVLLYPVPSFPGLHH